MSMNVVLVHPVHGAKIASHPTELADDLKNGWSEWCVLLEAPVIVESVNEVRESAVAPIEVPVIDVNALLAKTNTAPKSKK
jgi:hypothetical protein